MKKLLLFSGILLGSLNLWAFEKEFVCQSGIKSQNKTTTVELVPALNDQNQLSGQLTTTNGIIYFLVKKINTGFFFNAKTIGSNGSMSIFIEDIIQTLPKTESIDLENGESIFIHCWPYTLTDYCREHTC